MINVTTKYMKIGDERKKVFMIKGDESYVKPTDTTLTIVGDIAKTEVKGFKIPSLKAKVYRKIGSSTVYLYDGEEIIDSTTIASNTDEVTFSNIYLSYGVDHELYADFVGNDSCYGSKSKKIALNETLPSSLVTTISFGTPTTQISEGSTLSVSMTAKTNNVNVPDNTSIDIYVDDTYLDTVTTTSGSASKTISSSSLSKGKHTITATIQDSASINGTSNSYDVSVGYNVTIMEYRGNWIKNYPTSIKIRVLDWFNNPVTSGSVSFNGSSGSLGSNGQVTITDATISADGNYTATYGGSSSQQIYLYIYDITSVDTMTASPTVTAKGSSSTIDILLQATGEGRGLPVTISHSGTPSTVLLDANNHTTYTYNGNARGKNVTITASIGGESGSCTVNDYGIYWTPKRKYNFSLTGSYSETKSGLSITFPPSSYVMFNNSSSYNTIEFDVVSVGGTTQYYIGDVTRNKKIGLTNNDHIKVVWGNDSITFYRNGTSVDSISLSGLVSKGHWILKTNSTTNVRTLGINNILIY